MLLQTFVAIWWAAGLSSEVQWLQHQVVAMQDTQYTAPLAQRDFAIARQRQSDVERRVAAMEARVLELEIHGN